ncbi:hypothetical protein KA005_57615, partial [bacterium]|nr:hypothetical protein [bacterium]
MIDRILLGHNQFFGVNHLDAGVGNQKAARFSDQSRIMEIINFAYKEGVHAMMMSTHERATIVSEEIQRSGTLKNGLGLYLLVP